MTVELTVLPEMTVLGSWFKFNIFIHLSAMVLNDSMQTTILRQDGMKQRATSNNMVILATLIIVQGIFSWKKNLCECMIAIKAAYKAKENNSVYNAVP